jgi:hypothetical protein
MIEQNQECALLHILAQPEHPFWHEGEHFWSMSRIGVHDTRIDFLH